MVNNEAMDSVTAAPRPPDPGARVEARGAALPEAGEGSELVVALAQIAPRLGDVEANLDRHLSLIAEAAAAGAGLVVFPELSLTGYFLEELVPDVAVRLDSPELTRLAGACGEIDAVVGCVLETEDVRFHNAAVYLSGGRVVHVHHKVYLPTYGLFDDARYFAAGRSFRSFDARLRSSPTRRPWRAGILLCEDMWHPTAPALLARQGVELLLCPSSSPGRGITQGATLGTEQSYDHMTRTYAQLFTSYLVYCNRVGFEDGIGFWGGSRVVAPDGSLVGNPAGADERLVLHRLELGAVRRARINYPLLRDERLDVNDNETDRLRDRRARD